MTDEFIVVAKILGIREIGEDGERLSTEEMVRRLRADPEEFELVRSFWEHVFANSERTVAEEVLRLLFNAATYVSNLIDGPVPVLLPRQDVETMNIAGGTGNGPAMAIARSIQRLVKTQTDELQQPRDEQLLARIEDTIARAGLNAVPTHLRYINTNQMAKRLGLEPKTTRKLCRQGQIIARKLASGEWRTTEEDWEQSPYLKKKRRGNAAVE